MYGQYDPITQDNEAAEYAGQRQMVILVCPGEKGIKSLPTDDDHITSYAYETADDDTVSSVKWSVTALKEFDAITTQVKQQKPDILVIDGFHSLYSHIMNKVTNGAYLSGEDFDSKDYGAAHNMFGQYITALYHSSVPTIIATTWEEWEAFRDENPTNSKVIATTPRYLWPAIPGKMAKMIVGQFDARISSRIGKRCYHADCTESKEGIEHHLWQVMSKDDVMGVGVKGMQKIPKRLKEVPYIHQNADILWKLIAACT